MAVSTFVRHEVDHLLLLVPEALLDQVHQYGIYDDRQQLS